MYNGRTFISETYNEPPSFSSPSLSLSDQVHLTGERLKLVEGIPSTPSAPAAAAIHGKRGPSSSSSQFGAENQRVRPLGRLSHVIVVIGVVIVVVVVLETPKNAIETCDQDGRLIHTRVPQEGDVQCVRHRPSGVRKKRASTLYQHNTHSMRA